MDMEFYKCRFCDAEFTDSVLYGIHEEHHLSGEKYSINVVLEDSKNPEDGVPSELIIRNNKTEKYGYYKKSKNKRKRG